MLRMLQVCSMLRRGVLFAVPATLVAAIECGCGGGGGGGALVGGDDGGGLPNDASVGAGEAGSGDGHPVGSGDAGTPVKGDAGTSDHGDAGISDNGDAGTPGTSGNGDAGTSGTSGNGDAGGAGTDSGGGGAACNDTCLNHYGTDCQTEISACAGDATCNAAWNAYSACVCEAAGDPQKQALCRSDIDGTGNHLEQTLFDCANLAPWAHECGI